MTTAKRTRRPNQAIQAARVVLRLGLHVKVTDVMPHFPGKTYSNVYWAVERAADQGLIHREEGESGRNSSYAPGPAPARDRYPSVFHYAQGVTA